MNKLVLILFMFALSLSSCNRYPNTINSFDQESYSQDVVKYKQITTSNPLKHEINSYVLEDENNYIYTIQIIYNGHYLNQIKAIMIPFNYNASSSNILPCIGYSNSLNLSNDKDIEKGDYPGFNLSYKTAIKDLDFYLFFSYLDNENEQCEFVYTIDNFSNV